MKVVLILSCLFALAIAHRGHVRHSEAAVVAQELTSEKPMTVEESMTSPKLEATEASVETVASTEVPEATTEARLAEEAEATTMQIDLADEIIPAKINELLENIGAEASAILMEM